MHILIQKYQMFPNGQANVMLLSSINHARIQNVLSEEV